MVAGMVPSALALGDGGEFRAPMAIAVIGGLLVSTVLSLVFVPSFFTVMDDVGRFVWWIFGRFVGPTDEPPEYLASTRASPPRLHRAEPTAAASPPSYALADRASSAVLRGVMPPALGQRRLAMPARPRRGAAQAACAARTIALAA